MKRENISKKEFDRIFHSENTQSLLEALRRHKEKYHDKRGGVMDEQKEKLLDDYLKDDDFYTMYLSGKKKTQYRVAISNTMMFAAYCRERALNEFFGALSKEAPFKYIYNLAVYLNKLIFRKKR